MASEELEKLKGDVKILVVAMKKVGVPPKLIQSIDRKCLRTPRRQTGRIDRRTNREPRWKVAEDHPDFSPEIEAHLVRLRLFIGFLQMENAPSLEGDLLSELHNRYFGVDLPADMTKDPITDQALNYNELIEDVVTNPTHGHSKFHIGHQDPRFHPKHMHQNVKWQLKSSNDFQSTMDARVARIAYLIDGYTRTQDTQLIEEATIGIDKLRAETEST